MPKGYWIGRIDVGDEDKYKAYIAANAKPFAAHGARFLVRGGKFHSGEGTARQRNVVIEFPSYQAALDCWNSDDYQAARALRLGGAVAEILVIEGYEGPQPS
ncbi:MAG: DUF1330 domain-containing protein [Pseudomonadota bacterium]